MKRFEGKPDMVSRPHTPIELDTETFHGSAEQVKDYLFDQYMKQQLLEDFFDELSDYLRVGDIDKIKGALTQYSESDIYAALSLPKELREKNFEMLEQQIDNGSSPEEVIDGFVKRSAKYGFGIGYHTSPVDIRPDEERSSQWQIRGTEKDHRDDDRMMAYYSNKYRHLFKKKDPQFIYVVRTDPENHKTDGNWSRADSLSVIMRVPYRDVVEYVERTIKNESAAAGGAAAGDARP